MHTDIRTQEEVHANYKGRGRSLYKTPVTAAIDTLKYDARRLEQFDRRPAQYQSEIKDLIAQKEKAYESNWYTLQELRKSTRDVTQYDPKLDPKTIHQQILKHLQSYVRKLAKGNPPIIARLPQELQDYQKASIKETLRHPPRRP